MVEISKTALYAERQVHFTILHHPLSNSLEVVSKH